MNKKVFVTYLEAKHPEDNRVFEVQQMVKGEQFKIEVHLTDGQILSGGLVRYATKEEVESMRRITPNYNGYSAKDSG